MMASRVSEKRKQSTSRSVSDASDIENANTPMMTDIEPLVDFRINDEQNILGANKMDAGEHFKPRPRRGRPPGSGKKRNSPPTTCA